MRTNTTVHVSAEAIADTAQHHCDHGDSASYDVKSPDAITLYISGTPAELRRAGETLIRLAFEAQ